MSSNRLTKPRQEAKRCFDSKRFYSTTQRLYEAWEREDRGFENIKCFVAVSGCANTWLNFNINAYSSSFIKWLTGYSLEGSLILFTKKRIYLVCPRLVAFQVGLMEYHKEDDHQSGKMPPLEILEYQNTKRKQELVIEIIEMIKLIGSVGLFLDRVPLSRIDLYWHEMFGKIDRVVDVHDMGPAFCHLSRIKDKEELFFLRKAAEMLNRVWPATRKSYEQCINSAEKTTNGQLWLKILRHFNNKRLLGGLVVYEPKLVGMTTHSCGEYPVGLTESRAKTVLNCTNFPIIASIHCGVEAYFAKFTRVILLNPTENLIKAYQVILKMQQRVIAALVPGSTLGKAYEAGLSVLLKGNEKMIKFFRTSFGWSVSSRSWKPTECSIRPDSEEIVAAGMVFVVRIELSNFPYLPITEKKYSKASLAVADTVLVGTNGQNEVLTGEIPKDVESCIIRTDRKDNGPQSIPVTLGNRQMVLPVNRPWNRSIQPRQEERKYFESKRFYATTKQLYKAWKRKDRGFENIKCIVAVAGCFSSWYNNKVNSLSAAFIKWLTGYVLEGSLIFFTKKRIYLVCNHTVAYSVEMVKNHDDDDLRTIKFPPMEIMKYKKVNQLSEFLVGIIEMIKLIGSVGLFLDMAPLSKIDGFWNEMFGKIDRIVDVHDVGPAFCHLSRIKDKEEWFFMRKAAEILNRVWPSARFYYSGIIRGNKTVPHGQICLNIMEMFQNVNLLGGLIQYLPECRKAGITINSGGEYPKNLRTTNVNAVLKWIDSPIITSIWCEVEMYSVELTRVILVDPSPNMTQLYMTMLAIQKKVIAALKPGAKMQDVYNAGITYMKRKNPWIVQFLRTCFGWLIDLRKQNPPRCLIYKNNEETVVSGMVFMVRIELSHFPHKTIDGKRCKPASLAISDTVLVGTNGRNEVLTGKVPKDVESCTIRTDNKTHSDPEKMKN